MATGDSGAITPPHFCLDGSPDFFQIDEKIGRGGGNSRSSEK